MSLRVIFTSLQGHHYEYKFLISSFVKLPIKNYRLQNDKTAEASAQFSLC